MVEGEHVTDLPEPAGQAPTESTPPVPKGSTALESPAVVTKPHQSLDQLVDAARIAAVKDCESEVAAFTAAMASYRATLTEWSQIPVGDLGRSQLLNAISHADTPAALREAQLDLASFEAGEQGRGRNAVRMAIQRAEAKASQPAVEAATTLLAALDIHALGAHEAAREDERNAFAALTSFSDETDHSKRYDELRKQISELRSGIAFVRQDGVPWPGFDSVELFVKIPVEPAAKPIGILAKAKRLVSRK